MAGTKQGAIKRRQTLIKKLGGEEAYIESQRQTGAMGGAKPQRKKQKGSFASLRKRELKKIAAKGGKLGKRGKPPILGVEPDLPTIKPEEGTHRGA